MGFTCGFYKVKKLNDLSINQIKMINNYYDYHASDWAKANYPTWQEYCKMSFSNDFEEVSQENIDLYKDEYVEHEYHKSIFNEIESWCSNGSSFHDWFLRCGNRESDYMAILTKDVVIKALKNFMTTLDTMMDFKQVVVTRAFREDEETEVITSIPCDGVETMDEDNNIKREYTTDFELGNLFVPANGYFDEYKYDAYRRLVLCLIKILDEVDFDNEYVFYEGGW